LGHRQHTHRRRQKERLRPEEKLINIMPALTAKEVTLRPRNVNKHEVSKHQRR
jgi:hypothetical protein